MRIIAGEKKGFKLFTLPGEKTRPTTDFVKEAIFSMIFNCEGMKVLDLFSGSGSVGLEALSRGAEHLDLVDLSEKSFRVMKKNIDKLQYQDSAHIHKSKVDTFIKKSKEQYDLIFADPPYNQKLLNKTILEIVEHKIITRNGTLVIEHSSSEKVDKHWHRIINKQKRYGSTTVTFLAAGRHDH